MVPGRSLGVPVALVTIALVLAAGAAGASHLKDFPKKHKVVYQLIDPGPDKARLVLRNIQQHVEGVGGWQNIEAMELVLPDGELLEISETSEPDLLPAALVGLGALGVIATVTLRTVPTFMIRRTDSPLPLSETLERLQELADASDHFEFYVFPHTDVALLRQSERTDEPPDPRHPAIAFGQEVILENWVMGAIARAGRRMPSKIPRLSRFVASQLGKSVKVDRSYRVFATRRLIRFTEMEYAIPRQHAAEAIPRVLDVAERADPPVGFPPPGVRA